MQDPGSEYGNEPGGTVESSWESGATKAGESLSEGGGRMRRIRDEASQSLRSAREKVGEAYDRTADRAGRAYSGARGYAQANPGVAVATTFAAGLGLGMLIGSRATVRAYRRGLVPAFAVALAEAVRDVFSWRR